MSAGSKILIKKEGGMRVGAIVYGNEEIFKRVEPDAVAQLKNAAGIPGTLAAFALPDIHVGFGLPIGGVIVVDGEEGAVSPGAVGVDISCGVRLLKTPLALEDVKPYLERLIAEILKTVATGVGSKSRSPAFGNVPPHTFKSLVEGGVSALVRMGYATDDDVKNCEDGGVLRPANISDCGARAVSRGIRQLGTLGSGNHFLEVQRVVKAYDAGYAESFGLTEGQVCLMIHCGSRGFGEQIARDYVGIAQKAMGKYGISLPDRKIAAVPIKSPEGRRYISAMNGAANFAKVNRQIIMEEARRILVRMFNLNPGGLELLYDICHNLGKFETRGGRKVFLHRKGAVAAPLGVPVIIPGSMGTSSFVVAATGKAQDELWGSLNHGAGRAMSRTRALGKKGRGGLVSRQSLNEAMRGIYFRSGSGEDIRDEAPQVYKDINLVVDSLEQGGFLQKIVRLEPLAVLKG